MKPFAPYTDAQVQAILEAFEGSAHRLYWTIDPGRMAFWVRCNEIFEPGADSEYIPPNDAHIAVLRQTREQIPHALWPLVWVARQRRQRPLTTVLNDWRYARWAETAVPWFDAIQEGGKGDDQ